MESEDQKKIDKHYKKRAVETSLRIGFILLIFVMSFWILKPFIAPVLWGIVFAVGVYPLHKKLTKLLGNKEKLSATIISITGVLIIIVPIIVFANSTVDSVAHFVESVKDSTFHIPSPDHKIAEWPIVGKKIFEIWSLAVNNITSLFEKFTPQLKTLLPAVTGAIGSLFGSVFLFIISIIIAGALLLVAEPGKVAADKIFKVLVGEKAENFTDLAAATIRSVVQGVVGVSLIQTIFISIGLYAVDIPAAGILSILILLVAVMQLPLAVVMIPVIIYVFSYASTTVAVMFAVWSIIWSIADSFLKPLLLGKGMEIPMLVVLLGSIGGMMIGGAVGLFLGSVILALGYKIFMALLEEE